jgi:hypothetical protein
VLICVDEGELLHEIEELLVGEREDRVEERDRILSRIRRVLPLFRPFTLSNFRRVP